MMTPPLSISARPMCLRIRDPAARSRRSSCAAPFIRRGRSPAGSLESKITPPAPRAGRGPAGGCRPPPVRDRLGEPPDALVDPPRGHRGERQPQRPSPPPSTKNARPGREAPPRARRPAGRSAAASQPAGSVSSSEKPPRGSVQSRPSGMRRPSAASNAVAAPPVLARDPRDVAVEQAPLAEAVDGGLDERARVEIGELLGRLQPLDDGRRCHEPAEPQTREQDLRERADVDDDAVAVERLERARGRGRRSRGCRRSRPRRSARDGAPPRPAAAAPPRATWRARSGCGRSAGSRRASARGAPAAARARRPDGPSPSQGTGRSWAPNGAEHLHRARIRRLLDRHEVARIDERARDQIEALLRAVDDQDLLGARLDAEPQQVGGEVRRSGG